MTEIRASTSERGRPLLIYKQNKFYYERNLVSGEEKWRCCTKRCLSFLKVLGPDRQLVSSNDLHNHLPYSNEVLERQSMCVKPKRRAGRKETEPNSDTLLASQDDHQQGITGFNFVDVQNYVMDPESKVKWPHSQVRKLIGLIKGRQCLWNVKVPEYKDKDERERALSEIGEYFSMCSDEIRNKIHGLRSQYTSERGKMRKSELKALLSGTKCKYQTKWEFFHSLKFMFSPTEQDFSKIGDVKKDLAGSAITTTTPIIISNSNPIERNVTEEFHKSNERLQQSIPTTSKPNVLFNVRKPNTNESLKRKIDLVGEDDDTPERLRKTKESNRDEYHIYGELVACKIRKLPTSHAKNTVQHLINNILYEASLGKYNEVRRSHPLNECDSQLQNDDYGLSPLSCLSDPLNDDVVKEELMEDSSIEDILL